MFALESEEAVESGVVGDWIELANDQLYIITLLGWIEAVLHKFLETSGSEELGRHVETVCVRCAGRYEL